MKQVMAKIMIAQSTAKGIKMTLAIIAIMIKPWFPIHEVRIH